MRWERGSEIRKFLAIDGPSERNQLAKRKREKIALLEAVALSLQKKME